MLSGNGCLPARFSRGDPLWPDRPLVTLFGGCATRPLFAAQKAGTQTVLADYPEKGDKLKARPEWPQGVPPTEPRSRFLHDSLWF